MWTIRPLLALLLALPQVGAAPQPLWRAAEPDYQWSFPRDHWAHSGYKTEWWYFTGQLHSQEDADRRFGYQFTFFRILLGPDSPTVDSAWAAHSLIMGHAAVSDPQTGRHLFSEVLYREIPLLGGFGSYPESQVAWSRGPAGTREPWTLKWNGQGFDFKASDTRAGMAFQLSTLPVKPLVFQGPNGYSRKGNTSTAASQYYSFTRMATSGSLMVDGSTFSVEGESWMDREFGSNQLSESQVGWDWFSLQLEDRREIMLYHLRDRRGETDFSRGTLVSAEGEPRYLDREEWDVKVTKNWRSPETKAEYPAGWIVVLPAEDLRLQIVPLLEEQENRSRVLPDLYYWEGAVRILGPDGQPLGRGYVELTGYGTNNRPPV